MNGPTQTAIWVPSTDTNGGHGDVATDALGNDVWVSSCYTPYMDMPEGSTYYRRMDNGTAYVLTGLENGWGQSSAGMHFSGCAYNRPGWAILSFNNPGQPMVPRHGTIMAVELKPTSQRSYRLVHHHFDSLDYSASPFGTPNRDLTAVMFSSDWRNTGTPYLQYIIGLPSWAVS